MIMIVSHDSSYLSGVVRGAEGVDCSGKHSPR